MQSRRSHMFVRGLFGAVGQAAEEAAEAAGAAPAGLEAESEATEEAAEASPAAARPHPFLPVQGGEAGAGASP